MPKQVHEFAAAFSLQNYLTITSSNLSPSTPSSEAELFEQIAEHLKGKTRMGVVTPSKSFEAHWAVITIDEYGIPDSDERWEVVTKIRQALLEHGIDGHVERGKTINPVEYKIWVFWETAISPGRVTETLGGLLADLNLLDYTSLTPKTSSQLGHVMEMVWLPLFGGEADVIGKQRCGGVQLERTVFLEDEGKILSDQWQVVLKPNRVSASNFQALELATMPYQLEWQDQRAGYVAGPKELQKVLDYCPFVKWCEDQDGNFSKSLWDALISNLCRFGAPGSRKLSEISRRASDDTRSSGAIRCLPARAANLLGAAGPMTYEALKKLGWPGEIPLWPGSPAGWGLYLDLDRHTKEFAALVKSPKKLEDAITWHFQKEYFRIPFKEQTGWLKSLSAIVAISEEDLKARAKNNFDKIDLRGMNLGELFIISKSKGYDYTPERQGNLMYRWLLANGGKIFVDQHDTYFIAWRGQEAEVGKGKAFNALLYGATGVTTSTPPVNRIVAAFQAEAYSKALKIDQFGWLHTEESTSTVYLHLNSKGGKIIRITPGSVAELPNATNDEDVFLARTPKMREWDYLSLSQPEYESGIREIDNLVLKHMACSREDQLLYGCWALCYPLIGFVSSRPHLRLEGSSSAGKSRAMDLISYLVYGSSQLSAPTDAALISDAATNPLVLLENMESEHLKGALRDFILRGVSGFQKEKRKTGTVSGVVEEYVDCLINSTGVDNLMKTEMINRTIHIELDEVRQTPGGLPTSLYGEIKKQRSKLVSAQTVLASKMLMRIENGEWKSLEAKLTKDHPKFVLKRSIEYIALMALAAEEIVPIISPSTSARELVNTWIETQDQYALSTAIGANQLVALVEAIFAEGDRRVILKKPGKWPYELPCDGAKLQGSAAEFHQTFLTAKGRHRITYNYNNASHLTRRLKDSLSALNGAGYDLEWKKDGHRKHHVFTISRRSEEDGT